MFASLRFPSLVPLTFALLIAGCGGDDSSTSVTPHWKQIVATQMTDTQQLQRDIAEDVARAMGVQLKEQLLKVITEQGPVAAINVCGADAARIAEDVSHTENVASGRTSFKLRNPNNTPPTWAKHTVDEHIDAPTYVAHDDGSLAVLLPIHMQALCLTCHGPRDQIPQPIADVLQSRYPQDQAIGFALNDLRGWFWVEVPKPR